MTISDTWVTAINKYFEDLPEDDPLPSLAAIGAGVLRKAVDETRLHNTVCPKEERWPLPRSLSVYAVAEILRRIHIVRNIDLTADPSKGPLSQKQLGQSLGVLGVYDPAEGIYRIDGAGDELTSFLSREITLLDNTVRVADYDSVLRLLRCGAATVARTCDPNLIPVGNGIFDYKTKTLLPFSPDFVFLTKCPVNYVPSALNPNLHNDRDGTDWDIESWIDDLSDDPEIRSLLWEIIGAVIRPFIRWDKAVILYATKGNNGKGTFCALLRALCQNPAALQVSDFSQSFALEQLIGADAVISDENDVGTYIDQAGDFKRAVTGDVLSVNRKYKPRISYRFQGLIVQCYNDFPRVKDKTESFSRRLLYVPFSKCFTGAERDYIRDFYVRDKAVLEYVLQKVLNTDYYEFSEPEASRGTLHEYQVVNNPVADFAEDILPRLRWDLVPFTFLYDLYKEWFRRNCPSGVVQNARTFIRDFLPMLDEPFSDFACDDHTMPRRVTRTNMARPEPLIAEYNLENWMNPMYKGSNPNMACCPILKDMYRGILRNTAPGNNPQGPGTGPGGPEDDGSKPSVPGAGSKTGQSIPSPDPSEREDPDDPRWRNSRLGPPLRRDASAPDPLPYLRGETRLMDATPSNGPLGRPSRAPESPAPALAENPPSCYNSSRANPLNNETSM